MRKPFPEDMNCFDVNNIGANMKDELNPEEINSLITKNYATCNDGADCFYCPICAYKTSQAICDFINTRAEKTVPLDGQKVADVIAKYCEKYQVPFPHGLPQIIEGRFHAVKVVPEVEWPDELDPNDESLGEHKNKALVQNICKVANIMRSQCIQAFNKAFQTESVNNYKDGK